MADPRKIGSLLASSIVLDDEDGGREMRDFMPLDVVRQPGRRVSIGSPRGSAWGSRSC